MPKIVNNSHFVQRRLTESWEFDRPKRQRQLKFFDFESQTFNEKSSKSLLTAEEPFPDDVEARLNSLVETPLGQHLHVLDATQDLTPDLPWKQRRAILFSMLFQGARTHAARGDAGTLGRLRALLAEDESELDGIAIEAQNDFVVVGGSTRAHDELFFPCNGLAALPLVEGEFVMFQPTSLRTFVGCIPRRVDEEVALRQVREFVATGTIVAFSVGVNSNRVLIPPSLRDEEERQLRQRVLALRATATEMAALIRVAGRLSGAASSSAGGAMPPRR